MNSTAQTGGIDRKPCVAGSFYPEKENELRETLKNLFGALLPTEAVQEVRALIVPHAGYIFSGEVAATAFSALPSAKVYDNIFLIGSSHRETFPGASVYSRGDYITPLGRVTVNSLIVNKLIDESDLFSYYQPAHEGEHSLEVQLPFLQYLYGTNFRIVPVILGTSSIATCESIARTLSPWFNNKNLFIISSDFSHYPSYEDAVETDWSTAEALMTMNPSVFLKQIRKSSALGIAGLSTCMCGWTSALTLLELASGDNNLEFRHLSYRNSGDSRSGDRDRVVGYHAIALVEKQETTSKVITAHTGEQFDLTYSEKTVLLKIARENISARLYEKAPPVTEEKIITPKLKETLGAFVTLTINGKLRGCIGRFMPSNPLWQIVRDMALSAAFSDTRFDPLGREELKKVRIEISVLSPLKKISEISEIEPGKHWIYISKDYKSGTFLPQVAEGKNWTVEELLGYISRDKAGLGWNGWRDAEIFTYEAMVFEEEK
ncbi:MAG: AmmeMemoRadiSam system protein B [Bacteroidia bacterium]|nr:MAG: AmmeMemoRadiSam system protein B [Bacteroidia bacterium]